MRSNEGLTQPTSSQQRSRLTEDRTCIPRQVSVAIVSHTFATGPAHELVEFLRKRVSRIDFVGHPFDYAQDVRTSHEKFVAGRRVAVSRAPAWKLPGVMIFAKDLLYSIVWLAREKRGFDLYVGADGINCLAGLFLKRIGVVKQVVFYTIDYIPTRFPNPVLNHMYRALDRYCVHNSDLTWNLSPRMSQTRWHSPTRKHGREITVPIGVRLDRIKPRSINEIDRHTLVFIGHLRRGHGIELVVRALPKILSHVPETRLIVIGSGPIEEELKQAANELGLNDKITFVGFVTNHEDAEKILATCSIGLAPYEPIPDNITFYTDPGKPKLYLACGLPTIITAVPWIAEVISRQKMGTVIRFDEEQLAQAAIQLLTDNELYESYRKNALDYAQELDWSRIFENALNELSFASEEPPRAIIA